MTFKEKVNIPIDIPHIEDLSITRMLRHLIGYINNSCT